MRNSRQAKKHPHFADKHKKTRRTAAIVTLLFLAGVLAVSALVHSGGGGHIHSEKTEKQTRSLKELSSQTVSVLDGNAVKDIPIEEYIAHVVAAEMPAGYEEEALKAQATAARTYTLRKAQRGGCSRSEETDICTDSGHCQAYADEKTLKERWGSDYEKNFRKIQAAVAGTAGEVLVYEGEMIEALFCASAGGMTEDSENVYSEARDYLKSVKSPDTEGYTFEKTFSENELAGVLNDRLDADIKGDELADGLEVMSRYNSGRVKTFRIGDSTFSGKKIRSALGLSSTNFDLFFEDGEVVFTSVGYGHGIGMSQSGANVLAGEGMDHEEILLYYYKGVSIEKI